MKKWYYYDFERITRMIDKENKRRENAKKTYERTKAYKQKQEEQQLKVVDKEI